VSVVVDRYFMVGVKLEADDYPFCERNCKDDDLYEDMYEKWREKGHDGIKVVFDGMNGKYCFIGQVLYQLPEYRDSPIINLGELLAGLSMSEVAEKITKHFNIVSPEVNLWFFTHYH
jgi:hypothetical protein